MRAKVHVQNLRRASCKEAITNKLSSLKNISDVDVEFTEKTVSFDFYSNHDFERAKHVLSMIGYPIIGADNKLDAHM